MSDKLKPSLLSVLPEMKKKYECLDSHDIHPITEKKYLAKGYNQAINELSKILLCEEKLAKVMANISNLKTKSEDWNKLPKEIQESFIYMSKAIISNAASWIVKEK